MELQALLLELFQFNDQANKKMLEKIRKLPDKRESIRYFSHLINSQYKWLKRIQVFPEDPKMDWWEPLYEIEQLETEWSKSLKEWMDFLLAKTEKDLVAEVKFVGFDGSIFSASIKDICLQLNFHSVHHRAQMQTIIREQGLEPDFIDYISTKYKREEDAY